MVKTKYLIPAIWLLVVEIIIAIFVHDEIIRPYAGDFLVVIFIFYFIKAFINASLSKVAFGVLMFAYTIEYFQYINLIGMLGLQKSVIAKIFLGNSFSWIDIIAYTLGVVVVFLFENRQDAETKVRIIFGR